MTLTPDPWSLPALVAIVERIATHLERGVAFVVSDAACPAGLEGAIKRQISDHFPEVETIRPRNGASPAGEIATPFGAKPDVASLTSPVMEQHLAIVDLSGLDDESATDWVTFLERFLKQRRESDAGLALLMMNSNLQAQSLAQVLPIRWTETLRNGDLVIWAEQHLPSDRHGLEANLAVALAVELCAWRLDLAAALVRSARNDLADPLAWLAGREEIPLPGARSIGSGLVECPLVLRGRNPQEISRRIWRAQLSTIFPWLENERLMLIETHRQVLRIDHHLASLGVRDIHEIELGALVRQLSSRLTAGERSKAERLGRLRNDLAHRKPGQPSDVKSCL